MADRVESDIWASLCPGDQSVARQQDFDSIRLDGSGQWFIDDLNTDVWLRDNSALLLWLHGPSATGKTFLSSRIHNHIKRDAELKASNIAVAVYYFGQNSKFRNRADFDLAITSVIRQLASQLPDTHKEMWMALPHIYDLSGPSMYDLLMSIVSCFKKAFIILDGVNDAAYRSLLSLMDALKGIKGGRSGLRLLITSRDPPPVPSSKLSPLLSVEARASFSDLETYAATSMQDALAEQTPEARSEAKTLLLDRFCETSNGCFVPLPPTEFYKPKSEALAALAKFIESNPKIDSSTKIRDYCSKIMTQVKSHESANMICCVLYHLVSVETTYFFTLPMAYEALDAWGIYHEDGTKYTTSEINETCGSLLFLSNDGQTIRIRSLLLEEFLRREEFGAEWDERFVTASMRYLSEDTFATGACESSEELKERFKTHRYLWYAARMLSSKLFKSAPELFIPAFLQLSSRSGSINSYLQAAEAWPYHDDDTYDELEEWDGRWDCFTDGYQPLHLAAHLGAPASLINVLVERGDDLEACTANYETALHLAAGIEGEVSTLRALLASGSDVSATERLSETPLSIALVHGSVASVKLLFEYGADLSTMDEDHLHEVLEDCINEKPDIAEYLTERGVKMPYPEIDTYCYD
ncbi:hypothetical protein FDECE_2458 [Fusarium decemcellulare]|nr:hypothetical protein FDECE_2458 [Fusarium decemcellulare]